MSASLDALTIFSRQTTLSPLLVKPPQKDFKLRPSYLLHSPSKQIRRFILSAFLFAVLSAALAARLPSNVGHSLRQGGTRRPSLDSAVAFNIGGWPWPAERTGPGP